MDTVYRKNCGKKTYLFRKTGVNAVEILCQVLTGVTPQPIWRPFEEELLAHALFFPKHPEPMNESAAANVGANEAYAFFRQHEKELDWHWGGELDFVPCETQAHDPHTEQDASLLAMTARSCMPHCI